MNARTARRLAWSAVGLYFILVAAGIGLQAQAGETFLGLGLPFIIAYTLLLSAWPILGAIIVSRYPRQPVGWILFLTLLLWAKDIFTFGYASYGLGPGAGTLPGLNLALVASTWDGNAFGLFAFTLLLVLFPTGRPLSPGWRRVAWLAFAGLAVYLALSTFAPAQALIFGLPNPLSAPPSIWRLLGPLRWVSLGALALAPPLAVISALLRLRRARGEERQQMKWFFFAAALFPASIPVASYATLAGFRGTWFTIGFGLQVFAVTALGLAATLAIFKYRLYDIDLIINRTLVYGALTGTLALVYYLSVLLLQRIFPAESQLAIVVSTLTIAALFNPLRRRVQNDIDRRFYRWRYDAERAVTAFSAIVRDQVDLEALSTALLAIVEETMQPAQVSLWMPGDFPETGRYGSAGGLDRKVQPDRAQ